MRIVFAGTPEFAAEHLKADDGWQEIFKAVNVAPKRQVDKRDLKRILARL